MPYYINIEQPIIVLLNRFIKEEDAVIEENNKIYNSNTEVTSYGDEVSTKKEDNKSLLEWVFNV